MNNQIFKKNYKYYKNIKYYYNGYWGLGPIPNPLSSIINLKSSLKYLNL